MKGIQIFFLITSLVSSILIALMIGYTGEALCFRRSCILKARLMAENMDSNKNPCKEFYEFACGKSSSGTPRSSFDQTSDKISSYLKTIQEKDHNENPEYKIHRLSKLCVETFDRKFDVVTEPIFRHIVPVHTEGDEISITKYLINSWRRGFMPQLFTWRVLQPNNPGTMVIYISLPKHLSPLLKPEIIQKLYQQQNDAIAIFYYLFFGSEFRFKPEVLKNIISLDFDIARAANESIFSFEEEFEVDIHELKEIIPLIDWKEYFNDVLPQVIKTKAKIILENKSYFEALNKIIKRTETYTFYIFMVLNDIRGLFTFNAGNTVEAHVHAIELLSNYTGVHPFKTSYNFKFKFCENYVKHYFPGALASLLVEAFSIENSGYNILKFITTELKYQIRQRMRNLQLRNQMTKDYAELKLNSTKLFLSLPNDKFQSLTNSTERNHYYLGFCLEEGFTATLLCANRFLNQKNIELAEWRRKQSGFEADINTFSSKINYNFDDNELNVPTGLLQLPGFFEYWPFSVNFGAIGTVISAQLLQGFIFDEGKCHNEDGQSKIKWYTSDSITQEECKLSNVNEIRAVEAAYLAYQNHSTKMGRFFKDRLLPRFKSSDQTFFISYANLYCFKRDNLTGEETKLRNNRKSTVDALSKLRVFKDAFGCE